ncbi:MAG: tripartite tricarboxylate transporter substrate binding protein [Betaproteobacteria bacterium]|nr:tripartite tricarboxylate transporter substrate binding protein [Betaproteobacteria bacterium]
MLLRAVVVMFFLGLGALAAPSGAQNYPSKQLRFVLPFPTGGPTDLLGRLLGQKLSENLAQPVVPENRPGAGGNVGAEFASRQPADGYSIVLASNALAISPSLYKKLNYDLVRDFAPITLVAQVPNVFIVHPAVPAKNLKELAAIARASPGKITFGSGGLGTGQHLAAEIFKMTAKINILHVPYKGSGLAMVGMIGGHLDMLVIGAPPALPQIQAGKVRVLAALTADRLPFLPNVPTAIESGFPELVVMSWYGVLAPAGTPREVIARLNGELGKIVAAPDARERMETAGFIPLHSTPERFSEHIRSEMARYAKVIKSANLRIEQ